MKIFYTLLVSISLLSLPLGNSAYASDSLDFKLVSALSGILDNSPVEALQVNQYVQIGDFQMKVANLSAFAGHDASGEGYIYVPYSSFKGRWNKTTHIGNNTTTQIYHKTISIGS